MLSMVARIARAVRVPVTADLEAGYGTTPKAIAETVKAAIEAGAIGMNLEDLSGDEKIRWWNCRARSKNSGGAGSCVGDGSNVCVECTDGCVSGGGWIGGNAVRADGGTVAAYRKAGADCAFAPGITDLETITKLVKAVEAPLNVLATPACPPVAELEKAGVARVSTGSGIMRAAMGVVQRVAKEMIEGRSCQSMFEGATPYIDLKRMMTRRSSAAND